MSKKLLFKGGHATGMIPYEIEDFSTLYMMDARVDEKTKAYIDSVIGNSVLNLCPYRNVLVTHKYDTVEGNVITLDDCEDDEIIQLSEIQGNTMVNCNKDTDKELILMPNLDTNGYSNITLTEGIDGGKVDVSLEGNTMVNVCDQEDPVAITKSYTVETGNHVALQGEYDGKCRPNIYGNTLVNLADTIETNGANNIINRYDIYLKYIKDNCDYTVIFNANFDSSNTTEMGWLNHATSNWEGKLPNNTVVKGFNKIKITSSITDCHLRIKLTDINSFEISHVVILEGDYTNKPIPDYFTGMKSSFEDKLVPENLYKFSSRDDFYSLDGGTTLDGQYIKMTANSSYQNAMLKPLATIKPSTTYTIVVDVVENTLNSKLVITAPVKEKDVQLFTTQTFQIDAGKTGIFTQMATTSNDLSGCVRCLVNYLQNTNTTGSIKYRVMVVEGDYTNYDFTDYDSTKGGKYKVDYKVTGKNKFDINNEFTTPSTAGKEYITVNGNTTTFTPASAVGIRKYFKIKVNPNTTYNINGTVSHGMVVIYKHNINTDSFTWDTSYIHTYKNYTKQENATLSVQFTTGVDEHEVYVRFSNESVSKTSIFTNIQLEEGTTATNYEPYKESIKTLYLNSPLLEGDTIEQSGNNIVHNHRYGSVVLDGSEDETWYENIQWTNDDCTTRAFYVPQGRLSPKKANGEKNILCDRFIINAKMGIQETESVFGEAGTGAVYIRIKKDKLSTQDLAGFKQYLQQNPITVVYELAQPTQEIISTNDNLLLDSYTNGHLDVDSVIPIDKVVFQGNFNKSLRYLYPNTEYIIQFESNNSGKIDKLHLAGTNSDIFNVVKGVNKYTLTTGELSSKSIVINGIGFNMSKVVVTPKVDGDFGYFKGMKSVGQNDVDGHKIEILSRNKNLFYGDIEMGFINDINGKEMGWNEYFRCKEYIPCKPDTRYISTFKYSDELKYCYLLCYDKNKEFISGIKSWELSKQKTPIGCAYIRIAGQCINSGVVVLSNISEILINEDTATDYIPHAENKKEILMNEPLRGLPNGVRDKYVMIDGKWYIERNCKSVTLTNHSNIFIDGTLLYIQITDNLSNDICYSDKLPNLTINKYLTCDIGICVQYRDDNISRIYVKIPNVTTEEQLINYLVNNPIKVVCTLQTPTYEPIDYNPFEVYTDVTHISNDSIIPCNMVIKNTGYNCILKPNTKYTVSSSNGLSIVTTKDNIGDSVLRFCNKDTSKITKMNKVLVLEGDYVTGNPPIPAFFKGMESAFEQELVANEKDEHYGKYKVNVKAVGKNLLDESKGVINSSLGNSKTICIKVKPNTTYVYSSSVYKGAIAIYQLPFIVGNNTIVQELNNMGYNSSTISDSQSFTTSGSTNYIFMNYDRASNVQIEQGTKATEYEPHKQNNITFYINEPLRGVGNVKDKVYVKEDKVVVERNCGHKVLDGTETSWQAPSNDNYKHGVFTLYMPHLNHKEVKMDDKNEQGALCNTLRPYWWWTSKDSFETVPDNSIHYLAWDNYDTFYIIKKNLRTVDEFKQWLKANKTEYIYPLAEPVYEEVECDLSKLALEGYDHGTLFYDTNIPVTTQFYEFNINIKDMLIPNETYYVTFNADRVKDITINLSGVQVNYKTSMGYNKVPIQLGDVVNTNFSMDSRGVELSDLMVSTSTSLIYVKDMNDVCVYDEATNKYSITITSTNGKESDKRVILLDYPLLRLNKDIYDKLYYSNKDSRYRIDKKVFKHKFTNDREYSKYAAETNDTYYSSFISFDESIKDYVVITNEKVKTVKVEDDKYYFKIKWSDLGVSDKTEVNGNQGMKDFFNNNEVYLYYATDGFVEVIDELRRQTLKVYQPETFMKFSGNTTTTVTILIPMKNV